VSGYKQVLTVHDMTARYGVESMAVGGSCSYARD
jgi:hypothetical protein